MVRRPAVSMMQTSLPRRRASSTPARAAADRIGGLAEDGDTGLVAQDPELLDGGRALEVGADQERVAALLLPPQRQLGRGRRLARALEAGHQHDGGRPRGVGDLEALAAQHADQLLVDRLDHLLARGEALSKRLGADPEADAVAEAAGDRQLDVGLEQGGADLPERLVQVGLADAALAPQAGGDPLQAVGERVEHEVPRLAGPLSRHARRRA